MSSAVSERHSPTQDGEAMLHTEWANFDIDELLECEVALADHIADGSVAADTWRLDIIQELQAEITGRRRVT
jgi:hypothetical protein